MSGIRFFSYRVALAGLAAVLACGPQEDAAPPPAIPLELSASTDVPLGVNQSIALVEEDTACVDDSYEFHIRCVTRSGQVAGLFGREGGGPGEFSSFRSVERGSDGNVAVIDVGLSRLTLFRRDGVVLWETSLPRDFHGYQMANDEIVGTSIDRSADSVGSVPTVLNARTGRLVWSRPELTDAVDTDCLFLAQVGMDPAGGLVARDCGMPGGLAFFEHRDGQGTVVRSPGYFEEFPNERDLDAYVSGIVRVGRGSGSPSKATRNAWTASYRNRPKGWYRGPFRFDGRGNAWIAINRDRDAWSYIEVWDGPTYLSTVLVRDRLIGYDLLGETLVVLAERAPDAEGIAPVGIDWYMMPAWAVR